jgi:hypothetical protein
MYKYKILLNGIGGYYFSSLVKKEIIDYWLANKNIILLKDYILAQYMQDDEIDDSWKIPERYRFDVFNNIKSTCLWETDSIDYNSAMICDVYKLLSKNNNLDDFTKESDFDKHELLESFLCSSGLLINNNNRNWNVVIKEVLKQNSYESAYIIYFKTCARGYASHDKILSLEKPININKLKFHTKDFGLHEIKSNVIKKLIYNANTVEEKVLYDFYMLDSAREGLDHNFIALQEVKMTESKLLTKWLNK